MAAEADINNQWADELEQIKNVLAKTGLVETVKWGMPAYTFTGKNIVSVAVFKNYLSLWFFKGMFLKDAKQVLLKPDDEAKIMRQWRFTSVDEILQHEKLILQYVIEAIEVESCGLAKKPVKKPMPVSELLKETLAKDAALATAFETLSAYKQKEYIEHVESAKREQTRIDRLEKIKPMIMNRIGLNDKYK